jgi:hypothetical protein
LNGNPVGVIGFTGTQAGMKPAQRKTVRKLLWDVRKLHLGDCVGADAETFEEAVALGIMTIGHPPSLGNRRAFCIFDEERPMKPYLERNRELVDEAVDGLIAAPKEWVEVERSGTWATVRYARKLKRKIWIVLPDGTIRL